MGIDHVRCTTRGVQRQGVKVLNLAPQLSPRPLREQLTQLFGNQSILVSINDLVLVALGNPAPKSGDVI